MTAAEDENSEDSDTSDSEGDHDEEVTEAVQVAKAFAAALKSSSSRKGSMLSIFLKQVESASVSYPVKD